jgi:hypothetical protein
VGAYPLQLRDGDLILLRDAAAVVSDGAAATAVEGGAGSAAAKRRGGSKPWQVSIVEKGGAARREVGLSITTCFDAPASAPPPAAAEAS